MSKKEIHAWDRFWLWIKANEKVIWVALLVLLAPTFAFTTPFMNRPGSSNRVVYTIYGEKVKQHEYERANRNLVTVGALRGTPFVRREEGGGRVDTLGYLVDRAEAERMGIRVSDRELGAAVRQIYWGLLAEEAGVAALRGLEEVKGDARSKSPQARQSAYQQAFFGKYTELQKQDRFNDADQEDWYHKLQNADAYLRFRGVGRIGPIDRQQFEEGLREVMAAERLEEYVLSSVQITPQQVFDRFQEKEQSRKISFFEVRADEAREEVEKAAGEAEVKDYYQKHRDDFREPLKISTEYLSVPVAAYEKEVVISDEDLKREYDRVKRDKYQTFVGGGLEGFDLLSPEEKAEREKKAFRPLEEVKEEVRAEVLKARTRDQARSAAEQIQKRLVPEKPGAIGEKKEEKPAPPPATFADIQKDFPLVKTGSTPFVDREEVEKAVPPEAYSSQLKTWFDQAEGLTPDRTPKRTLEAPSTFMAAPTSDPQGVKHYIFYRNPQVRQPLVPKLEDVKDKVRAALVKEKLLERSREKAKRISEEIASGKAKFEEAARSAGREVVTTGFVERDGSITVPLSAEEAKKAEAEPPKEDQPPPRKEKEHPGSRVILDHAFNPLREKGKVDGFAEDRENGVCYVVRWDDKIFPDAARFEREQDYLRRELLRERQTAYLADWKKKLWQRASPMTPARSEEGGSTRRPAPVPEDFE